MPERKHTEPEQERRPSKGSKITRRSLLAGAAGAAGAALISHSAKGDTPGAPQAAQGGSDPTKVRGRPASAVGERSVFERPERLVTNSPGGVSLTPIQHLDGIITPSDLHFERHHAGVPRIDPDDYFLLIHGMVERPMKFTLDDLKRFPARTQVCFMECSGNGGATYSGNPNPERTPQQVDGLFSTSEWTGVPLATLFREVGLSEDAKWFLAEGTDASMMTRSIPTEKAWDDAMIAYGQNGEAIRPEQGYPARLLLPGWEGNANVKWIRRIDVSDRPFMTRWETAKYSDPLADGTARIFSFEIDAKSVITSPVYPTTIPAPGWWQISGLAWSGRGKIVRVDISTDNGRNWEAAELEEPVMAKCSTRFRYLWNWSGAESVLMSRAVDETGYVQPTVEQLHAARGVGSRYHYNSIRSWTVKSDGAVVFGREG